VTFRWKDYRAGNKQKLMTLDAEEFIRRFLLHVLPYLHRKRQAIRISSHVRAGS
jgi:hypothetical protein